MAGLHPDAVVVVATVRALKYNGGVRQGRRWARRTWRPWRRACPTCCQHVENITEVYGLPVRGGHQPLPHRHRGGAASWCEQLLPGAGRQRSPRPRCGPRAARAAWTWPRRSLRLCEQPNHFHLLLRAGQLLHRGEDRRPSPRRSTTPTAWYYTAAAQKQARGARAELGFGSLPICMAKTQYSLSDDADPAGRAQGLHHHGAQCEGCPPAPGFMVALTGDIMTMPGLPKVPAAEQHRRGRERQDHRPVLIHSTG